MISPLPLPLKSGSNCMVPKCLFPMTRFSQLRIAHHQIPGNQGHLYGVLPLLIQIFPASLGILGIVIFALLTMFFHPGEGTLIFFLIENPFVHPADKLGHIDCFHPHTQ